MNKKQLAFLVSDISLLFVSAFSLGTTVHRFSAATIGTIQIWLTAAIVGLLITTVVLWFLPSRFRENGRIS